MQDIGWFLLVVIRAYFFVLLARLVIDWVQMFARSWRPRGLVLVLVEIVYTLTDPPIKLVRRYVPPLRIGAIAFDTAFLIVFVAVIVLQQLVAAIFIV